MGFKVVRQLSGTGIVAADDTEGIQGLSQTSHQGTAHETVRLALSCDEQNCRQLEPNISAFKSEKISKKNLNDLYAQQTQGSGQTNLIYNRPLAPNAFCVPPCLDLVEDKTSHILKGDAQKFPLIFKQSKRFLLFDGLRSHGSKRAVDDLGKLISQHTPALWPHSIFYTVDHWILQSVDRKNKPRHVLDGNITSVSSNHSSGTTEPPNFSNEKYCSSPSINDMPSPWTSFSGEQKYVPNVIGHVSSYSDAHSSPLQLSSCGQLKAVFHCIGKHGGGPRFEFCVQGHRELYIANLVEAESINNTALDHMYLFRLCSSGQKELRDGRVASSKIVGKMMVSSCITLDANNLKHMESEFVLFGLGDSHKHEAGKLQAFQKHKLSPSKVVNMFRSNTSSKHRFASMYEDSAFNRPSNVSRQPPSNFELSAVVLRTSFPEKNQGRRDEGWGLKFLRGVTRAGQKDSSVSRNTSSVHVTALVPPGFHGGPQTENGGPSSLIERWKTSGHCDCGGWDVGCPLTVLDNRQSVGRSSRLADSENLRSLNLFTKGSKEGEPIFQIVYQWLFTTREDFVQEAHIHHNFILVKCLHDPCLSYGSFHFSSPSQLSSLASVQDVCTTPALLFPAMFSCYQRWSPASMHAFHIGYAGELACSFARGFMNNGKQTSQADI